jgi:hypothetical protein
MSDLACFDKLGRQFGAYRLGFRSYLPDLATMTPSIRLGTFQRLA